MFEFRVESGKKIVAKIVPLNKKSFHSMGHFIGKKLAVKYPTEVAKLDDTKRIRNSIYFLKGYGYTEEVENTLHKWEPEELGALLSGKIIAMPQPDIAVILINRKSSYGDIVDHEISGRKDYILTNNDYNLRIKISVCEIGDEIGIVFEGDLKQKEGYKEKMYRVFKKKQT